MREEKNGRLPITPSDYKSWEFILCTWLADYRLQKLPTTCSVFEYVSMHVCMLYVCMYVYVHTSLLKYAVIYGHFIQNVTDFTIKMCPHMMICNYILGFQISVRFRMTISSLNFQYLSFEIAPIPKKQEKWPPKAASVNKYLSLCLIGNKVQWYASSIRNGLKLNKNEHEFSICESR